jgi:hypothetical protein
MKCWVVAAAIAIVLGVNLGAQKPGSSSELMKTVTITGCVQAAPNLPAGTSGGASSRPTLLLTNASSRFGGSRGPTATIYRVSNDSLLKGRVGQKVQVTGTVNKSAWTNTSDLDLSQAGAIRLVPGIAVRSVKSVASTCP